MTSNIGADLIKNQGGSGFGFGKRDAETNYLKMKDVLQKEAERFFRPEFLNRLDDLIVFQSLKREDLETIVKYELSKVFGRLEEKGYCLILGKDAQEFLIDKGYDLEFGARPLRRAIERYVEDPLSEQLLMGTFGEKTNIKVSVLDKELHFEGIDQADIEEPSDPDPKESEEEIVATDQ